MKSFNWKKGALFMAVVSGFGVLLVTVALLLTLNFPRLARALWQKCRGEKIDPGKLSAWMLATGPKCVALMERVALWFCLSVKREVRGLEVFASERGDEIYVLVANHPPLVNLFTAQAVAATAVGRGVAIVKREFLTHPLLAWLGWAGYLSGLFIPINRGEVKEAQASTRQAMLRLSELKHPVVVIVFPDGHRPTDERVAETQAYLLQNGHPPIIAKQFTDTALPKSGTLWATLRALEEAGLRERVRVIDGTYGLSKKSGSLRDAWHIFGGTAHYRFADVTDQAWGWRSVEECRRWLLLRWVVKNWLLRRWRGETFQVPR